MTAESTGKVARFQDAVEGVDLSYEVVGSALKETLTLASAAAPSVYRFDVESGGLTPRPAASGAVHFVDGEGRRQLGFATPWMRDANGVVSQAVAYEIEREGPSSRIALRVDEKWLRAPERRFPVVVDPTIYRPAEHICEIRSGASANTSYCDGTLGSLRAGRDSSGIVHRNLFDLEDLSLVVPDYAQVLSSYLAVYMIGQSPVETSQIDLHHLTRGFAPGATWNTSDGRTAWSSAGGDFDPAREARASTPGTPPDDQLAFDMTELAQRIVGHAEPSGNLLLKAADESRTHLDTYWWPEVMVRWSHRTGLSPRYTFEHRELSDGSMLDINLANGNLVLLSNDIDLESDDGRFTVGRYFNNKNLGESSGSFGRGSRGDFGSISLERNAQDGSYIFFGPGADDGVFHKQIDGTFTAPPQLDATLTEQLDGTVTIDFNDSTETWTFDTAGRLVQTRQDYGYTIDGTYGSDGLTTLRDSLGHAATFAYDGSDDMRTITDEQSAVHRYDYDSSHRLITYTSPASAQTRYAYDSSNRLQRITFPDRTALRISYYSGSTSPQYVTPVDASGVDQPATVYDGDFEYTTVDPPSPTARNVYFYDPYTLVTDLVQTGSAAAIAATGAIPDLDGGYTRGDAALTVDVSAAQVPDGIQLTELEVDRVEVDSQGAWPCDQWTCPTRARETLTYDPRSDPEGTYEYQVNTVDGDDERTVTPIWRIAIDRTAPATPSGFSIYFDAERATSEIYWDAVADPELADRTPGSGVAFAEYRLRRDGGAWADWQGDDGRGIDVLDSFDGEVIAVEVRAVDLAGNVGSTGTATLTADDVPSRKVSLTVPDAGTSEDREWTPELNGGERLRLADGGQRVVAVDSGDRELRTIATAWAVDAAGRDVPMSYTLSGSTVTIHVDHQSTGVKYPVLADTDSESWTMAELNHAYGLLWQSDSSSLMNSTLDDGPVAQAAYRANSAEISFCLSGFNRRNARLCWEFEKDRKIAVDMQNAVFSQAPNHSRGDSFRHSTWVALMTITAGNRQREEEALRQGERHEANSPPSDPRDRDEFFRAKRMDLRNNYVGHAAVLTYHDANNSWPSNPWACSRVQTLSRNAWYWSASSGWWREARMTFFQRGATYYRTPTRRCSDWD